MIVIAWVLKFFIFCFLISMTGLIYAKELIGDWRPRSPEMKINSQGQFSGPIKDIIEEALAELNLNIKWQNVPWV